MPNAVYPQVGLFSPISLLVVALFAASAMLGHTAVYSLSPSQDAYTDSNGTTFNNEELDVGYRLFADGPSAYHAALKFDLPGSLSNALVQSAILKLFYFDAWETFDTQIVRVQRATQSWSEDSLSYDISLDAGYSDALVGGNSSNFCWISWDALPAVNSWFADPSANFGLVLSSLGANNAVRFVSQENVSSTLRPVLEIQYLEQPPVEDKYGHFLYITNNDNLYFGGGFFSPFADFTNRLSIRNPTLSPSRIGYVELSGALDGGTVLQFPIPIIPGGETIQVDVNGTLYPGTVYATLYENASVTNQAPLGQDSRAMLVYNPSSNPPTGGVPVAGASYSAPGFRPLPALVDVAIAGPTLISANSPADYTAKAVFNNGVFDTNTAAAWSSSTFQISNGGRIIAGSVSSDTPVTITGTLTYGQITKSATITATVLAPATPSLKVAYTRNILMVTWPATATGFALEETSTLGNGSWFAVPNVETNETEFRFKSGANQGTKFFRLRKPSSGTN